MYSRYPPNQTLPWCDTDTKERWESNRISQADRLKRYGWWESQNIEYSFNSQGFRSAEFDPNRKGIMFLGCSISMGAGLHRQHTWCERVSEKLGLPCWNLSQGGTGMDTCFRLAEHWIPRLKPTRVMMLCAPARFEILDSQNRPRVQLPAEQLSKKNTSTGALAEFYREWISNPENIRLHNLKNLWATQLLCDRANIPLHHWAWADMFDNNTVDDLARDLLHPGAQQQAQFAELVLRQIDAGGTD